MKKHSSVNFFSIYIYTCPVNTHYHFNCKTDLGLRSRTFSLKINKLPTFSEITQAQCLKIVFLRPDEFTY